MRGVFIDWIHLYGFCHTPFEVLFLDADPRVGLVDTIGYVGRGWRFRLFRFLSELSWLFPALVFLIVSQYEEQFYKAVPLS